MLITPYHANLYRMYHDAHPPTSSRSKWVGRVDSLLCELNIDELLDYGCGSARGLTPHFSGVWTQDYDPGVKEFSDLPEPSDLVVCIHALEHVEPECVDYVLAHLMDLSRRALLIVVSCEHSTKKLPDGREWHTFVRTRWWWDKKLQSMGNFVEQKPIIERVGAEYAALLIKED